MDLRTYLFENRISQKEFAEKTGINRQTVNYLVKGARIPGEIMAKFIEMYTKGKVTFEELRNPIKQKKKKAIHTNHTDQGKQ